MTCQHLKMLTGDTLGAKTAHTWERKNRRVIALSPQDYEVVVIGTGLAGHCTALSTVESSTQMLLVEK